MGTFGKRKVPDDGQPVGQDRMTEPCTVQERHRLDAGDLCKTDLMERQGNGFAELGGSGPELSGQKGVGRIVRRGTEKGKIQPGKGNASGQDSVFDPFQGIRQGQSGQGTAVQERTGPDLFQSVRKTDFLQAPAGPERTGPDALHRIRKDQGLDVETFGKGAVRNAYAGITDVGQGFGNRGVIVFPSRFPKKAGQAVSGKSGQLQIDETVAPFQAALFEIRERVRQDQDSQVGQTGKHPAGQPADGFVFNRGRNADPGSGTGIGGQGQSVSGILKREQSRVLFGHCGPDRLHFIQKCVTPNVCRVIRIRLRNGEYDRCRRDRLTAAAA